MTQRWRGAHHGPGPARRARQCQSAHRVPTALLCSSTRAGRGLGRAGLARRQSGGDVGGCRALLRKPRSRGCENGEDTDSSPLTLDGVVAMVAKDPIETAEVQELCRRSASGLGPYRASGPVALRRPCALRCDRTREEEAIASAEKEKKWKGEEERGNDKKDISARFSLKRQK